ncbi:Hypothetical Protein FCC1311_030472 [Hondaea fermentalgiana]|uniref:Saposin B-type domain-containing protein n=1 Tax=Hondaea fermentalgiana TaxID=2315210 RepID=A0A2R5G8F5_9STRA|nr:Hypothetical Protein FCC1311_030472 [Hondaea fermentalgiana]|eukprot:GBG26825.1 Hypothetical Protein FCC1311_030472 [Hondaea fermentalgiana]
MEQMMKEKGTAREATLATRGAGAKKTLRGAVAGVLVAVALATLVGPSQAAFGAQNPQGEASEDDGNDGPPESLTEEQMAEILKQAGGGEGGFGDLGAGGFGDFGGMGGDGEMDLSQMLGSMGGDVMGMQDFGGMGDMAMVRDTEPVASDFKFIICETCENLVENAWKQTAALRAKFPNTKISEDRIDDALEKICTSKEEAGEWIARLDMVEADDRIRLVDQGKVGRCMLECKTIEGACAKVFEEINTDLVEALYLMRSDLDALKTRFCQKGIRRMKGACGKPYPSVPESREPGGDNFIAKTQQELDMDEINRKIRASQLGSFNAKEL